MVIWLVEREKSVWVGFQALQALVFQAAVAVSTVLVVYVFYGAYQIYQGREFRYRWIGDWLQRGSVGN